MPTQLFETFFGGELSTGSMLLRLGLMCCSMFAMVHLISLWGTRYGDRNTLSKSFFLSLVLHGCFGMGWATVAESFPLSPVGEEPLVVQTPINLVDDVDSAPQKGTSKQPIFFAGPANGETPLTREPHRLNRFDVVRDVEAIDSPKVMHTPEAVMPAELPEFQSQPEESAPGLDRSEAPTSKSVAEVPPAIDPQMSPSRTEVSPRGNATRSTINSQESAGVEAPARPTLSRGTSMQLTPTSEEGAVISLPAEIAPDAPQQPVGRPNDETIRRPGSPNPVAATEPHVGSSADSNSNATTLLKPRRAARSSQGSVRGTETGDDVPSRPALPKSSYNDVSRMADSRASGDRLMSGGSSDSLDVSPIPKIEKPKSGSMTRSPARAPETYQARSSGQRMSSVLKNGGSEESEQAVENSLKWLASVQESDGRWSSSRFGGGSVNIDPQDNNRGEDGKHSDTGITGLVILSYLGAGYTHEKGPYTSEVRRALDWLIDQQDRQDGYLIGRAKNYDRNYCHAMATFALAEAYAMQRDAYDFPELRNAVRFGVRKISELQNLDGGWRYEKRRQESDMSMFGWQLMALKSAVNGGINVREDTLQGMRQFLKTNTVGEHGGLAGYKKGNPPTPAMTAEAMFCRQMFAVRANDAASREGVAFLLQHLPRVTEYDEYYWYYGTLAMRNVDDESWQRWNDSLRDMLISQQRKQGSLAGSWDPRGKWAGIGGRLYSTALSTMCLEVYYRYQTNPTKASE